MKHLPNAFTCGNLLCGCFGILMLPDHSPEVAAYFVWAACLFDFFDGFIARTLKVSSPIGKELDSLADMVSFGILPAMSMYWLIHESGSDPRWAYAALSLAVFSALRLARFNVDENQKTSFIGLPTPAAALFITSLVFLPEGVHTLLFNAPILILITLIFSLLLVAPIELFALKFDHFRWAGNSVRFTFVAASVLLLTLLRAGSIPLIILLYISVSLVMKALKVQKN